MSHEIFQSDSLKIEKKDEQDLSLLFLGKSMSQNPGAFLLPILTKSLDEAQSQNKRLVLDFSALEYFNSSTMTPLIRLLKQVRSSSASLSVYYNKNENWQHLSFSALQVFSSHDGRLNIVGR